jgi:hypothetical protein
MRCQECKEIWDGIDARTNVLTETGRRAERIAALPLHKMTVENKREFAQLMLQYQMVKAEMDGLKIALEIHNRLRH